jgi:anaerobic ribonucleoside-triphosphate reductase activating protein
MKKVLDELDHPYISGLSILGGEPLDPKNQKGVLDIVKKSKQLHPEKKIWCYTGFKFDDDIINKMFGTLEYTKELMSYIDVLVDGKFEEDKKDLKLKFRGSSNQRIIDVQESLKENKIVPYNLTV